MVWKKNNIADPASRAELVAFGKSVTDELHTCHMRYLVDWVDLTNSENASTHAYTYEDAEGARGYSVYQQHERPLNFSFGELIFYRKPLTRFDLWLEPLVAGTQTNSTEIKIQGMLELGDGLGKAGAISLEGVGTESDFYKQLNRDPRIRKNFLLLPVGKEFEHRRIEMPESYDAYLLQQSKHARKAFKYKVNRLKRDFNDEVELRSFETLSEVDAWLDDAIEISKKTYQWNLLGIGLRDRDMLHRQLTYAAERGWFRCYILYCQGEPTCFMQGFQIENRYFYEDVGYDPKWARQSVGTVLQLLVLQDLYTRDDSPISFDFSTGDAEHKARFGNASRRELNLLLIPRTLGNRVLIALFQLSVWVSDTARALAEKFKIKAALKRVLRRASGTKV